MKYYHYLLPLILFLLSSTLGFSDSSKGYLYEYLNVSNGLSSNSITRVVKGELGQFWFASSEGIVKLDAQGFEYLKPSARYDQFYSEDVETLELGENNTLWVGTKSGGLSSYDIAKDQFVSYNHLFKDYSRNNSFLRITSLKETSNGHLCVGTWMSGFFVMDIAAQKIIFHQPNNRVIQSIQEVNDGNVWFGSGGNLFEYDFHFNKVKRHSIKSEQWVTKMIYDHKRDVLYFGSSKGVYEYSFQTHTAKKFIGKNDENLKLINSLSIDQQGRLWVGTWKNGLFRSNPEKSMFHNIDLRPPHEFNKNYQGVTDIFIDNNDIIYITTTHGGVVKLTENKGIYKIANTVKESIGLPDNNINSIFVDRLDNQWIGTKNGGLAYKRSSEQQYNKIPASKNLLISDFAPIKDQMFVGTSDGLLVLSLHDPFGKSSFYGSSKFRKIKSIFHDQSNQKIWFGLQQSGIACVDISDGNFDPKKAKYYNPMSKGGHYFEADRVEHIVEADQENFWLGTFNGLYKFNKITRTSTFIDLKGKFNFPSNIILSLFKHPSLPVLYVGSANGLLALDTSKEELKAIKFYNHNSGLENDCINAITLDQENRLWLGLSKGISCINLNNHTIQNYTKEDGVNISSINLGAVFNKKDLIYFGGQKGMILFSPSFISNHNTLPDVYFSQLYINNQYIQVDDTLNNRVVLKEALPFTKEIELGYQDKVIRLSVNTTNYVDQKNVDYFYRIKTVSDQWIDNQHSSSINFTQLPVGKNVLEIKACLYGNCGETNQLLIDVKPAPWFSTSAFIIYILIALLIIYGVFQFFIRKEKLENQVRLIHLEKEKEHEITEAKVRFFTNISHEIRTPLTLIHSPLEDLLEEEDLPSKYRSKLQIINKNADNLLVLVNQLLDFRKMENNKLELSYDYVSIRKVVESKCWEFQSLLQLSGLRLDFKSKVKENQLYKLDQEKIEIVLNNLLSNAIKFTPKGKEITLELTVKDQIEIKVIDQGVGIKEEDLKNIFNRYYQGSEQPSKTGTGIGLALSKSIVNLHGGDILVKSDYGKGTAFTVELPILDEKVEDQKQVDSTTSTSEKQNSLLLVDDNKDILLYLESIFEKDYHITKAENGKEALQLLEKQSVDLIISDVMMPVMDGMEFCQTVKNHPDYQNIPIILLTANATTENELNSLKIGANDYLRKPFNSKVIKEKVNNLLAYKAQLLQFYTSQLQPQSIQKQEAEEKPKILSEDEKFIQKAVIYIEENIDNDELNVEQLSDHMCMSQSTLYRKIKAVTNNTIVGFIRSVRLKKGAQLLMDTDLELKEIAEKVGINDLRYFKREFKKQYGVDPAYCRENRSVEIPKDIVID
ncbi:hybrid sensor histidine kinase/response regulator transcription factor [Flammeovirga aprica]|uniref:histidine kinase n=1 Tax=Flammeovirga aprica JL-4 TaxID=694437 RepID=A0A7X9RXN0_9BACT|nr:ATP-binding protein [Flammeovirga aprica]NME70583.1 response regulator [Flammeovirga aprica JL-4]